MNVNQISNNNVIINNTLSPVQNNTEVSRTGELIIGITVS
jgi:hypothetical protein